MSLYNDDDEDQLSPFAVPRAAVPIGGTATSAPAAAAAAPVLGTPKPVPLGTSQLDKDQSEVARLRDTGSGVDQFGQHHNKLLAGLAHVADAVGGAMFPTIAQNIPGTSLHHSLLLHQAQGAVNNDQAGLLKAAQTADIQSKPELAQSKIDALSAQNDAKNQHQTDALEANLHAHGFKHDQSGQVVPLSYHEMSEQQQAVHDLKGSQEEVAEATKALKEAQAKNEPVKVQMAQQRIATAQRNAETARGRLGLQKDEFDANYLGTHNGQALPGVDKDPNGTPIGTRVSNANNATGQRLNKGDLAQNVSDNVDSAVSILQRRPDLLGKVAGRFTSASQMVGTGDADIDRLGVIIHNAALASNGVHGVRGEGAVEATEKQLLNGFKNSPQATIAGLQELKKSMGTFTSAARQGRKPLKPGSAPETQANQGDPKVGDVKTFPNGKTAKWDGQGWEAQ